MSDLKSLGPLTEVAAGLSAFIYSPVSPNPRTGGLMGFYRAILKTRIFITVPDSLRNPKCKVQYYRCGVLTALDCFPGFGQGASLT